MFNARLRTPGSLGSDSCCSDELICAMSALFLLMVVWARSGRVCRSLYSAVADESSCWASVEELRSESMSWPMFSELYFCTEGTSAYWRSAL